MRKLILSLAVALPLLALGASPSHLRVTHAGGETLFSFDDKPEITFNGTRLHVAAASQSSTTAFELDDVHSLDFVAADQVDAVAASDVKVRIDSEGLTVANLAAGTQADVYALNGTHMLSLTAPEGTCTVSRRSLPAGVYVFRAGGTSFKFSF